MAATILLTGASGYIGGRLLRRLEEGGCAVRCLARRPERVFPGRATTEVVAGDCLDASSLVAAMVGVDQAYYLVHSMATGPGFAARDRQAAANFGRAAARAGVRRIIYLGGLGDAPDALSTHLKSRLETGAALREAGVPVAEFRASIIVGAGSLSFEMIRALVERLPVMICPRWVDTRTQPIAIDDVLAYLRAALDLPYGREAVFEIGGPEVVSYGDMMRQYAWLRRLKRLLIPVPVLTPRLSGLWLSLVAPAQARVGRALVEGLRNPTVVRSLAARDTFAIRPMPMREAFVRAIEEDAPAQRKIDTRLVVVDAPPAQAFAPIRRIGGAKGWYFGDALWRLRGWLDAWVGGAGMPRYRRDPEACAIGDVIDGWRVEAYEPDHLLRLAAGLKLPGRGWLEFRVAPIGDGTRSVIRQTAIFDPRGVTGRLYWYGVLPLHALVFRGLLRQIARRADTAAPAAVLSTFSYSSIIDAPAAEVFRWHERPGALAALSPSRLLCVERQEGGIIDGGRVTLSIGVGPARVRWIMRHYGYVAGRRFCDEQARGPFGFWRHAHRFDPIGPSQTLYQDHIEFGVVRNRPLNRVAAAALRPLLTLAFARRHRIVRASVGRTQGRVAPHRLVAAIVAMVTALAGSAIAQDTAGMAILRGRVVDAQQVPQGDVAVCAPGVSQCVVTDDAGAFTLMLRPGIYTLELVAPGRLLVVSSDIQVRAGLDNLVQLALPQAQNFEQTVSVTAPALVVPEEVKTSGFVIPAQAIAGSAGALQDVARYVQSLPGVAFGTDDFRNDLIVRGGSPLENLYIVDNVEIPNINNFATFASAGGTVSMLDVQLIDNVTFLTGGYPAPFGSRTSSVLQVTGREGRRDRIGGRATVGFAGAGAVVEGPLGSNGNGSWIVSVRRSFLDLFTSDTGIGGVPVLYTVNGKAVYDLSPRDRVWAVNISGVDRIRLGLTGNSDLSDELSNLDIRYAGRRVASGVNWQRTYGRGVGLLGATYSRATVSQRVVDLLKNGIPSADEPIDQQIAAGAFVFGEESTEADASIKYDHTVDLPRLARVRAGASLKVSRLNYDVESPFGSDGPFFTVPDVNPFSVRRQFSAFQSGAYAQATRTVAPRLDVTAGARIDHYGFISTTRVSPRAGAEFALSRRASLRASYGQYYQQPFFLFLTAYPENRSLKPFRADHYVGGVRYQIDAATRVGIETYRKTYRDYPVSSQIASLSLANVGDTFAVRDTLFPMVSEGTGVVTGIEASAELKPLDGGRLHGEANLSFSRARYAGLDRVRRAGSFDYPVVANVTGSFQMSARWKVSTKASYLGGRPYTPLDLVVSAAQRRAVYDLSRINAERAPDDFRLDIRVDRTFRRGQRVATVFAGLQNVTNRRNFAGFAWDRRNNRPKSLEQLGAFPVVGLEWPF